jgi:hypothetical protein
MIMASSMAGQSGYGTTGKPQKIGNTGYNSFTSQQFTPEQMQLFSRGFQNVSPDSYLSKLAGGDEESFNELEAPALKQFAGLQGGLASRFSGQGGTGARRSSGFQNASNSAAQDFASQLQSQRLGIRNNALQQLHSMSQDLLGQRPYEQYITPKKKPFWQELVAGLAGSAGQAGAQLAGNAGTLAMMA